MECAKDAIASFSLVKKMGMTEEGIEGERKLFKFLWKKGVDVFQPDAIGLNKGKYELYEVKNQERYRPPPFEGHGLPPQQIKNRLLFQQKTGKQKWQVT